MEQVHKQNYNLINYLFNYSGYIVTIFCFIKKQKPKSKPKKNRRRRYN